MPKCPSCKTVELTALRKGGYLCEECNRRFAVTPREPKLGGTVRLATREWDDPTLPFAIAHPLARARDLKLPLDERLDAVVFAAYQAVRLSGILLLSDYLLCQQTSKRLDLAVRALRVPDWWGWTVLNNQLVRFFAGELDVPPDRDTVFEKIAAGWRSVNRKSAAKRDTKWATLLAGLPGRNGDAQSANDALWRAREDRERRQGQATENLLFQLIRIVEATCQKLFPKAAFELVRRVSSEGGKQHLVRLSGAASDGVFDVEIRGADWAEPFSLTPVIALTASASVPVHALPLLFDAETQIFPFGAGGLLEPASLDPSKRTARIASFGIQRGTRLAPLLGLFARREVSPLLSGGQVSAANLASWSSALVSLRTAAQEGVTYFPSAYVERRGVDDVVESSLGTSGRALLLVGPDGSGKSSFVHRLASRLVRPREPATPGGRPQGSRDLVVLLSGRAAYAHDPYDSAAVGLCRTVLARLGLRDGAFASLHELFSALDPSAMQRENRRFYLLLDGVDEAEDFEGTLSAIDDLLPGIGRYPFLRLLITMRETSFHALGRASYAPRALTAEKTLAHFYDPETRALVPFLRLRPFDDDEREAAYTRRDATRAGGDRQEHDRSPYALHLSHRLGRTGTESALVDALLDGADGELPSLPDAVQTSAAAIAHRKTLDVMTREPSRRRGTQPRALDLPTLLAAGVLAPPDDDGRLVAPPYVFSSRAIEEEIVLRGLAPTAPAAWPSGEELVAILKKASTPALTGGAERLVRRMAEVGDATTLTWILTLDDGIFRERLLVTALTAIAHIPARAGKALMEAFAEIATRPGVWSKLSPALSTARRLLARSGRLRHARMLAKLHQHGLRDQIAGKERPQGYWGALAATLAEDAELAREEGNADEARKLTAEALSIERGVAEAHPGDPAAQGSLARRLIAVGAEELAEGRVATALSLAREARSFAERAVAMEQPEILATCLALEGRAERLRGDHAAAEARLQEALRARRSQVAQGSPDDHRLYNLAKVMRELAEIQHENGRFDAARRTLDDAQTALRAVVAREPYFLDAQREIFLGLRLLAAIAKHEGRRDEASRDLQEALEGARWLASYDRRPDRRADVVGLLRDTGVLSFLEGKRGKAKRSLDEAVRLAQAIRDEGHQPDALVEEQAGSLAELGNVCRAEGKHREARAYFESAIAVSRWLYDASHGREDRAFSLANLLFAAYQVESRENKARLLGQLREILAGRGASTHPGIQRLSAMVSQLS